MSFIVLIPYPVRNLEESVEASLPSSFSMQVFLFQENGNPDGVVYTEVNIGKDGKPRPKERNSIKKKVNLRNRFKKENVERIVIL